MCDCADTFHRKCCQQPSEEPRRPRPSPEYLKALLLALLCAAIGYLLYSLDRRTIKKILCMLGFGFLCAEQAKTSKQVNKPDSCAPKNLEKPDPCAPKYLEKPDPCVPKKKPCECKLKPTNPCAKPPVCTCCPKK